MHTPPLVGRPASQPSACMTRRNGGVAFSHAIFPLPHGVKRAQACHQRLTSACSSSDAACSPHIRSFHERIAVGSSPISAASLDALLAAHGGTVEAAHSREASALSHFEIVTALAFKHFQEQQVRRPASSASMYSSCEREESVAGSSAGMVCF